MLDLIKQSSTKQHPIAKGAVATNNSPLAAAVITIGLLLLQLLSLACYDTSTIPAPPVSSLQLSSATDDFPEAITFTGSILKKKEFLVKLIDEDKQRYFNSSGESKSIAGATKAFYTGKWSISRQGSLDNLLITDFFLFNNGRNQFLNLSPTSLQQETLHCKAGYKLAAGNYRITLTVGDSSDKDKVFASYSADVSVEELFLLPKGVSLSAIASASQKIELPPDSAIIPAEPIIVDPLLLPVTFGMTQTAQATDKFINFSNFVLHSKEKFSRVLFRPSSKAVLHYSSDLIRPASNKGMILEETTVSIPYDDSAAAGFIQVNIDVYDNYGQSVDIVVYLNNK